MRAGFPVVPVAPGRALFYRNMKRKFHIVTYGCQMNKYDSAALRALLEGEGHIWTESPRDADVIIVNTCAVRQHAEDRALGRLRALVGLKKRRPWVSVGVIGCVAQKLGEKLLEQIPGLDFVVGTDRLDVIPRIVEGDIPGGVFVDTKPDFTGLGVPAHTKEGAVSAFVTIMRGCNNFCTYCIVPYVRGRERSRSPDEILREVRELLQRGVVEITLLGQNVNSYRFGDTDFPKLLGMVAELEGLLRLRFVTNHPKDFSDAVLDVVEAHRDVIPPSFHLPLQSGSDAILRAMNRRYTAAYYLDLVERIYRRFPDAAITTDIICGFPGETEADHRATLNVMRRVGFAGTFAFRYSVRPGTAAAKLPDDVPEDVKIRRLNEVIALGIELAKDFSRRLLGTLQDVLVEGVAPKNPGMLRGTAPSGRTVLLSAACGAKRGEIIPVEITEAGTWVLWGSVVKGAFARR